MLHRPGLRGRFENRAELEAGDDAALQHLGVLQRLGHTRGMARIGYPVGTALDLEPQHDRRRAKDLDHLVEQQHALAAGALEHQLRQRGPILRRDRPLAVRGAVQRVVVDHHQLAVAGRMDVELDLLDRQLRGVVEGDAAVLGPQQRAAAVRSNVCHQVLVYRRVGSSRSRSQSPTMLIDSVVSTITAAGESMIHGARVKYSRP